MSAPGIGEYHYGIVAPLKAALAISLVCNLASCSSPSDLEGSSEPAAPESADALESAAALEPERPATPSAPDTTSAEPIDEDLVEALEALDYVPSAPTGNPEDRGVTVLEPGAWPGLNLYSSRHESSAVLMDNRGRVVHRWQSDRPGAEWMHVEPLPNGDLLAITKDIDIARFDWASNLLWRAAIPAHHDVAIHEDGRLFVPVRGRFDLSSEGRPAPVLGEGIAILTPDGEVERTVSLLPLLTPFIPRRRLARIAERAAQTSEPDVGPGRFADVLHTNSIAFLEHDLEGVAPAGSVLLSFRTIGRVMILNAEMSEVLFSFGEGELQAQHDATQLDNGHLLIFDNGYRRQESRAVEVDVPSGQIVWEGRVPDLFSPLRGGAQRLPNDNVLITEADSGRAVEITRAGELVWEFWNPDVRVEDGEERRAILYRVNRFPSDWFEPL